MPQTAKRPQALLSAAGAVLCCVLWGSAFPCTKILYAAFRIDSGRAAEQLLLAGLRFLGAGLLLLALESARGAHPFRQSPGQIGQMAGFGLFQTGVQYACFYLSMNWLSGGRASLINTTNAFLSVILAHFFCENDRLNRNKLTGCLLGGAGILLMGGGGGAGNPGDVLMFLSALTFSLGNILCQRLTRRFRPTTLAGWQMLCGGLGLCTLGLLLGGRLGVGAAAGWAALAFLTAQSAVTFGIWSCLLTYGPVSGIGVYTCIVPAVSMLLSAALPGEPQITLSSLISLLLVALGVVFVNLPGAAARGR